MAQFAPIFCFFVFMALWCGFMLVMCTLWWSAKRPYSF
uniref:ATP synthase F0 subunit 8 n=1 Tax=Paratapes textilis TaxID=990946 RepID=H6BHU3_9BIVA|nr:ATP synthase F0 subunit 8 [Paratapes textilis]AEH99636.1 ATP synthase F0 subunit 8 [Paratapes textilis]